MRMLTRNLTAEKNSKNILMWKSFLGTRCKKERQKSCAWTVVRDDFEERG